MFTTVHPIRTDGSDGFFTHPAIKRIIAELNTWHIYCLVAMKSVFWVSGAQHGRFLSVTAIGGCNEQTEKSGGNNQRCDSS